MSYQFYLVTHLIGIFLIVASLGGISLHVMNGGTRQFAMRKWAAAFHGVGLLLAFIAGFGLMAKIGLARSPWPAWIFVKLGVWLVLGALPALIYRKARLAKVLWLSIFLFSGLAAYMAIYKPTFGSMPSNPDEATLSAPAESPEAQSPTEESPSN